MKEKVSLRTAVARLEDGIIVLSGPALAISGIIAGVDLVTGGNILKSMSWLALVWAITLLLTLDFQVLALGVRAHRVYTAAQKSNKRKVAEIAIAVVIAAAISFISIQMQSIIARVNAENITIDLAAVQLGINTIALIWERSSLVLVLIFMSGWLREHDSTSTPVSTPAPVAPAPLDWKDMLQEFAKLQQSTIETVIERTMERVTVTISEQKAETLQIAAPASDTQNILANDLEIDRKEDEQPIFLERFQSKEQAIAAILQRAPGATPEQVAHEAGCSIRTANKWIQRSYETGA